MEKAELLDEKEKIRIAKIAERKNMNFEDLYYSDYMYGKEDQTEDVWEYVMECRRIGTDDFYEKYD